MPFELQEQVNKWFILAIVSIFVGCGLFGILNVVFMNTAKEAVARGDFNTATNKIKTVKTLCIIGWAITGLAVVFQLVAMFVVGVI